MNPKIVCIGELLIDFICKDIDSDLIDGEKFEKKAGGAPANVCAAAAKLGRYLQLMLLFPISIRRLLIQYLHLTSFSIL